MALEPPSQAGPSLGRLSKENENYVESLHSEATKLPASPGTASGVNDKNKAPSSVNDSETYAEPKPVFNPAILKAKYDAERDKRLAANSAGLQQYIPVDHNDPVFGKYLRDPYITNRISRGPIKKETEVLIIGGGYGGQLVAVRLIEKGITDITIVEKGGDFGGTW